MGWYRQIAIVLMLCAMACAQAASPAGQDSSRPAPKPQLPQADALPASPGATLKEEIEAAVRTEPACNANFSPCVLTTREKFRLFERKSYSPLTFVNAAFDAGWSQISGDTYGPGMEGVAKRYGANLADTESRTFFQTFLFSSMFGQDPRYHRLGNGGLLYRATYAASRVAVGRSDSGHPAWNVPEFLGVAATEALANAYYPDRDCGFGRTMSRIVGSFASDAGTNVLREFWPDIRARLRKHEPQSIQKLDNRIGSLSQARP